MEALAAVALVGNVLQFIETAKKLYDTGLEIRRSNYGSTAQNERKRETMERLSTTLAELSHDAEQVRASQKNPRTSDLATQCMVKARQISQDVEELRVPKSASWLRTVQGAWRSGKAQGKINEKIKQLEESQDQLKLQIIVDIRKFQSDASAATLDISRQCTRMNLTQEKGLEIVQDLIHSSAESIVETLTKEIGSKSEEVSNALKTWESSTEQARRRLAVLKSLYFDEIRLRLDEIKSAHSDTLAWVFDEKHKLAGWLEKGDGLFWVTGHAGSGKSTFMKFVQQHKTTTQYLKVWAGDANLITAGFYFWAASKNRMQRSLQGLLRCILFEIIQQCSDPIDYTLGPNLAGLHSDLLERHSWTNFELLGCIQNAGARSTNTRYCFFIDGLDEYEDSVDPQASEISKSGNLMVNSAYEIREIIEILQKLPAFKLCISSRPWNVFTNAFGSPERHIKMHELNKVDIHTYVRAELSQEVPWKRSYADDHFIESIESTIVRRSEGVFLWVVLVTRNVHRSLNNGDPEETIRARLDDMPGELDKFFLHMIESSENFYQKDLVRILNIVSRSEQMKAVVATAGYKASHSLPLLLFQPIYDPHPNTKFGFMAPTELLIHPEAKAETMLNTASAQFQARCPDLLKISQFHSGPNVHVCSVAERLRSTTVELIHRSASDFLRSPDTLAVLRDKYRSMHEEDEIDTSILSGLLLTLRTKIIHTHDNADDCKRNECAFFSGRVDVGVSYKLLLYSSRSLNKGLARHVIDELFTILLQNDLANPRRKISNLDPDSPVSLRDDRLCRVGDTTNLNFFSVELERPRLSTKLGEIEYFPEVEAVRTGIFSLDLMWYFEEKCTSYPKERLDVLFKIYYDAVRYGSGEGLDFPGSPFFMPMFRVLHYFFWFLDHGLQPNEVTANQRTSAVKITVWECWIELVLDIVAGEESIDPDKTPNDYLKAAELTRRFLTCGASRDVYIPWNKDLRESKEDELGLDTLLTDFFEPFPELGQELLDLIKQLDAEEQQAQQASKGPDSEEPPLDEANAEEPLDIPTATDTTEDKTQQPGNSDDGFGPENSDGKAVPLRSAPEPYVIFWWFSEILDCIRHKFTSTATVSN